MLGNYARDPDRFEAMDALFQEFLCGAGLTIGQDPAFAEANQAHNALIEQAAAMRYEIVSLEEQREAIRKKLERGESFLNKFLNSADPSDLKASQNDVEMRLKHQEVKLEEMGPQIDAAKQKLDFLIRIIRARLGDYLNDPENAKRLFDASDGDTETTEKARLLAQLVDRLEQHDVLYHVLAATKSARLRRTIARRFTCNSFEKRWSPKTR